MKGRADHYTTVIKKTMDNKDDIERTIDMAVEQFKKKVSQQIMCEIGNVRGGYFVSRSSKCRLCK